MIYEKKKTERLEVGCFGFGAVWRCSCVEPEVGLDTSMEYSGELKIWWMVVSTRLLDVVWLVHQQDEKMLWILFGY